MTHLEAEYGFIALCKHLLGVGNYTMERQPNSFMKNYSSWQHISLFTTLTLLQSNICQMFLVSEQYTDLFTATLEHVSETWSPCSVKEKCTSIVHLVMNAVTIQNAWGRWRKEGGGRDGCKWEWQLCVRPVLLCGCWLCNEMSCNQENSAVPCDPPAKPLSVYIAALFLWGPVPQQWSCSHAEIKTVNCDDGYLKETGAQTQLWLNSANSFLSYLSCAWALGWKSLSSCPAAEMKWTHILYHRAPREAAEQDKSAAQGLSVRWFHPTQM